MAITKDMLVEDTEVEMICIGEVMLMDTPDMFYFVVEMSNLGVNGKEC